MANPHLNSLCPEIEPVLDRLIALSLEKQNALIKNDIPLLENIVADEKQLLEDCKRLTNERCLGPSFAEKVHRLKALNESNQRLVETALNLVRHELSLWLLPESGYSGSTRNGPFVFDKRI